MNHVPSLLTLGMLISALPAAAAPDAAISYWFKRPANSFLESCPIGNGRLGAMDFGGTEEYRVVLNESSVWSGGYYEGNRPDAVQNLAKGRELYFSGDVPAAQNWFAHKFQYPDGVSGWWNENQFGCYQILSDLYLRFPIKGGRTVVTSPSGHAAGDRGGSKASVMMMGGIGGPPTPRNRTTITRSTAPPMATRARNGACCAKTRTSSGRCNCPQPTEVRGYQLTSADDVPARDPENWKLEGSQDGKSWTVVDQQVLPAPFEQRHMTKKFTGGQAREVFALPLHLRHHPRPLVPTRRSRARRRFHRHPPAGSGRLPPRTRCDDRPGDHPLQPERRDLHPPDGRLEKGRGHRAASHRRQAGRAQFHRLALAQPRSQGPHRKRRPDPRSPARLRQTRRWRSGHQNRRRARRPGQRRQSDLRPGRLPL